MAQKLCCYVNSWPCSETDPEFIAPCRCVGPFRRLDTLARGASSILSVWRIENRPDCCAVGFKWLAALAVGMGCSSSGGAASLEGGGDLAGASGASGETSGTAGSANGAAGSTTSSGGGNGAAGSTTSSGGGTAGSANSSDGGAGVNANGEAGSTEAGLGSPPFQCADPAPNRTAPSAVWVNATGNLANMASECGNLGLVSANPCSAMVIAGVAKAGLWGTEDAGKTWRKLGSGAGSAVITNRISSVVYDPAHPGTFWESGIYNGGGVYKTTNNGVTFEQLGDVTHTDSVSIDFSDPERKTLLAGPHEATSKLFRSTDAGKTWTDIGKMLPASAGYCTASQVLSATNLLVGCAAAASTERPTAALGARSAARESSRSRSWPATGPSMAGQQGGLNVEHRSRTALRAGRRCQPRPRRRRNRLPGRAARWPHRRHGQRPLADFIGQGRYVEAHRRTPSLPRRRLQRGARPGLFGANEDVLHLAMGLRKQRTARRHHERRFRLHQGIAQRNAARRATRSRAAARGLLGALALLPQILTTRSIVGAAIRPLNLTEQAISRIGEAWLARRRGSTWLNG